jgi:hypothetical protein
VEVLGVEPSSFAYQAEHCRLYACRFGDGCPSKFDQRCFSPPSLGTKPCVTRTLSAVGRFS